MNLVYPAEITPSHRQATLARLFDKDLVRMPLEGLRLRDASAIFPNAGVIDDGD